MTGRDVLDLDDKCSGLSLSDLQKRVKDAKIEFPIAFDRVKRTELCKTLKESVLVDNLKNMLYGGNCKNMSKVSLLKVAEDVGIKVNPSVSVASLCLELQKEFFTRYYVSRGVKYGLTEKEVMDFLEGKPIKDIKPLTLAFGNVFPEMTQNPSKENLDYFRTTIWPLLLTEPLVDLDKPFTREVVRTSPTRVLAPKTKTAQQVIQELSKFDEDVPSPL